MGILYTILTDRKGHYALSLDKEFLYRTDDTIHGDKYCYVVDHIKSAKELITRAEYEEFVNKHCEGSSKSELGYTET